MEILSDGRSVTSLSGSNINFLEHRISDGNLNEAIDLARVAWDQFPRLRESTDAKRTIALLMEGLQEKMNVQVLVPVGNTMTAMTAIIDRLEKLAQTNPSLIEQGFNRTLEGFRAEMTSIRAAIHEPTAKIGELNILVSELMHKPIARGTFGESVITDLWNEQFTKDLIKQVGGAGREDLLIRPYLGNNGSARFGDTIALERKSGKQKFSGSHRMEAIRHAREKGASIAMLVYDNQDNLPQAVKPVSISRERGILIVVCELQSGTWRLAREMLEVIDVAMTAANKNINEINIEQVQQVAAELGSIVKVLEQIRGNGAKIKSCADEVEQSALTIKAVVKDYQEKIHSAISGIGNCGYS
jgi:hypothetical protein